MRNWLFYIRIAAVAAFGFFVGSLRADDGDGVPIPDQTGPVIADPAGPVIADPAGPVIADPPGFAPYAEDPEHPGWVYVPAKPKHDGPVWNWLRGCCCWSHFKTYKCGTFKSEFTYVFGSCRSFFGDTCAKTPPPALIPVGYDPPPGYGYSTRGSGSGAGAGGCGCR